MTEPVLLAGIRKYRPKCVYAGAGEALEAESVFTGRMVGDLYIGYMLLISDG